MGVRVLTTEGWSAAQAVGTASSALSARGLVGSCAPSQLQKVAEEQESPRTGANVPSLCLAFCYPNLSPP